MHPHHSAHPLRARVQSLTPVRLSATIERAFHRSREPMDRREFVVELLCALSLLAVAAALPLISGDAAPEAGPAIVATLALAAVLRVQFEVGSGSAFATQIVFVPLLFVCGPAWTPAFVAAACVVSRIPEMLRTKPLSRHALLATGNAWYSVGPAIVLTAASVSQPSWDHAAVIGLALLAASVMDLLVAIIRGVPLGVPPMMQVRMMGLVVLVDLALTPIGLLAADAAHDQPYALLAVLPLAALLDVFARERAARIQQQLELSSAYRGTAMLLADVIEADDEYTGEHSQGVVEYALAIADELRVDADERRLVEFGALLHDVGKISIPDAIINKPGKLDDAEWALMKQHTIFGQQMLDKVGGALTDVGVVVRASHEHWDGRGYPDGLSEYEIPLAARIVCVADAYSAMTTTRSYRKAMTPEAAIEELVRCAGTQFDPSATGALITVIRREMRAFQDRRKGFRVVA